MWHSTSLHEFCNKKWPLEILLVKLRGSKELHADFGWAGVGAPKRRVVRGSTAHSYCYAAQSVQLIVGPQRFHRLPVAGFHLHRNVFLVHTLQPSHLQGLISKWQTLVFCIIEYQWYYNSWAKLNGLNYPGGQVKSQVRCTQRDKSVTKATLRSVCILAEWRFINPFFLAAF